MVINRLNALSTGFLVYTTLASASASAATASILGTTSHGIYLLVDKTQVLFITHEPARGPMTIVLPQLPDTFQAMLTGDPATLTSYTIHFPDTGLDILCRPETIWLAPPADLLAIDPNGILKRLHQVATYVAIQKNGLGLIPLLTPLLQTDSTTTEPQSLNPEMASHLKGLIRLIQALMTRDLPTASQELTRHLGLGRGLTPSFDDLASGVLLALNRWGSPLEAPEWLPDLNLAVTQSARQKTTTLSTNMIENAAHGYADERLLSGIDGLLTGQPAPDQCARALVHFGSSSGADALVGMAIAILAWKKEKP
jgi:hypothetical protein